MKMILKWKQSSSGYDPTLEEDYNLLLPVGDQKIKLEIVDTAGQQEYASLRDQHLRVGDAFLFVYSVASRGSFEEITELKVAIERVKDDPVPMVLVAHTHDRDDYRNRERQVSVQEGKDLAREYGWKYFEACARTNFGCGEPLLALGHALLGIYSPTPPARIFALIVFVCDGLLRVKKEEEASQRAATRFFRIASQLPMDLQMVLCHRLTNSTANNISRSDREESFQSLARHEGDVAKNTGWFNTWKATLTKKKTRKGLFSFSK